MIKFDNVSLKYINDFYCLYNFSVEINSNTLFVGDEFSGTHAILRLIAKVDKQYEGNIFYDDKNIKTIKDKDLSVAYVSKIPYLFENKNTYENLYYPLKIRKFSKKQAKNIINDAISYYNLNFLKKIKHADLSYKKIVSLVRAVIRKPKYILLEDFFEDLNENYFELANKILDTAKQSSIIIACEKDVENLKHFNDFKVISFYEFQ